MRKPAMVLRNSPIYFLIFLALVFVFSDIVFSFNIIFKTEGVLWYTSIARIFCVTISVILGISSLNDFFSRAYVFDDRIELKTFFRTSTFLFKDVVNLQYKIRSGRYAALGFFIFCGKDDKQLWRLPISFVKPLIDKQQFISFLIHQIPGLQVDQQCNNFLNMRSRV